MNNDQYFIVRTDRAGVFFGKIKENKTTSIIMIDVRKIHHWEGAAAVEQIAVSGVNEKSRLTISINEMEIAAPIQIIPCTEEALNNLKAHKEWKR
jgi:hypothetical protein